MTVYLDSDYKIHLEPGEGLREITKEELDPFLSETLANYRLVPEGETWARGDGTEFQGFMLAPWRNV